MVVSSYGYSCGYEFVLFFLDRRGGIKDERGGLDGLGGLGGLGDLNDWSSKLDPNVTEYL